MNCIRAIRLGFIYIRRLNARNVPQFCNLTQKRYKHSGEDNQNKPLVSKLLYPLVIVLFIAPAINSKWMKELISVEAAKGGAEKKEKKDGKEKTGFRDRKIIEYENRIRQYSTPEKVFRYFATFQMHDHHREVLMTPDDFVRSVTPGMKQPEGLGLDQYRKYDLEAVQQRMERTLRKDSIFYKLGSAGLISFSDYIFLLTVLSTSPRDFEIAFRVLDLNGDGNVDCEEFEEVTSLIRQQASIGYKQSSGNSFKDHKSALAVYFFGTACTGKLTIEMFLDFQKKLQEEILSLEFQRKHPDDNGRIREIDFAQLLVTYADYPSKKVARILKRVKKSFKNQSEGISKEDYLLFFSFLNHINDVESALTFYQIAGASVDEQTFKRVSKTVAHVELSDHLVHVVFTIFDENQDGQLSNKEFVAVMKKRLLRGLEKPRDTHFIKLMQAVIKCAIQTRSSFLTV